MPRPVSCRQTQGIVSCHLRLRDCDGLISGDDGLKCHNLGATDTDTPLSSDK